MRLKKTFAGVLAAAMMVCAVSVPAFAAQDVEAAEEENCISSTYVVMNIPYAQFYKSAGVENEVDAVTSATKSKTRAGNLANGSYHVNSDGSDITGVSFPVKVLTPWALDSSKQVTDDTSYDITVKLRGKDTTTTYSGVNALFENDSYAYYKLSEAPALLCNGMVQCVHRQLGVRQGQGHRNDRERRNRRAGYERPSYRLRDEGQRF